MGQHHGRHTGSARDAAILGAGLLVAATLAIVLLAIVIEDWRCDDGCRHPLPAGSGWEYDTNAWQWTAQLGVAGAATVFAAAAAGFALANRLRAAGVAATLAICVDVGWAELLGGTSWV